MRVVRSRFTKWASARRSRNQSAPRQLASLVGRSGERYAVGPAAEGAAIRTVRIEAPSTSAAELLVRDLVPFARTDVLPLEGERWEVRVEESTAEELDAVLLAVAR